MRRSVCVILASVSFVLAVGSAETRAQGTAKSQLSTEGPKFRFRMIGMTSAQLRQYTVVEKPYFGEGGIVAQRSHGRVQFVLNSGAEMGVRDADHPRLLSLGTVDFAQISTSFIGVKLPLALGADLAGIYPDFPTARRAMELLMPRLSKYTEEQQGLKLLGHFAFSGDVLYCRVPIKGIDDLKGKRIRSFGPAVVDLLDGLGAVVVPLAFGEVYSALQQGVVDCAVTDRSSGNAQRWWEAASYLYTLPVALAPGFYAVNLKVWSSLPQDVQRFLQEIHDEVTEKQWELARTLAQVGTDCNLGKAANCPTDLGIVATRPMTLVEPSKEDYAKLKDVLTNVAIPRWVKRCGTAVVTEDECRLIFNETIGRAAGIALTK